MEVSLRRASLFFNGEHGRAVKRYQDDSSNRDNEDERQDDISCFDVGRSRIFFMFYMVSGF